MYKAPIRKNVCNMGLKFTDKFKDWATTCLTSSCSIEYIEKFEYFIQFDNEDDMTMYLLTWTEEIMPVANRQTGKVFKLHPLTL